MMPKLIKNPKTLSLVLSVIGIFIIVVLAQVLEPRLIKISDLNKKMLDEYVQVQGQVEDIQKIKSQDYPNPIILITLKNQSNQITVVWRRDITLSQNQILRVTGKVSEYENETQIEASKIKILS
jgi:RecJ-like exonuclease